MKRPILIHPDPRLKKSCAAVDDLSDELRVLADDMLETMYAAPGIGLAAPQIGVLSRLIVLDCAKKDAGEEARPLVMFNPRILAASDERNVYEEGCLSIPEQYADVERPKVVDVEWLDRDGRLHTETFDGLWATCVQHEIDHLDGKLFIDYLKPLRRQMITRKMVKLKKERAGKRPERVAVLQILAWPDPRLSQACSPVVEASAVEALVTDMFETMYAAPGRGLAAPQVGVLSRLFVMDAGWKDGDMTPCACLDPEIVSRSEATVVGQEGCLSVPGVTAQVRRSAEIVLAFTDLSGVRQRQVLTGAAAIIAQHEMDHLDGVMHFDHLSQADRSALLDEYRKASA